MAVKISAREFSLGARIPRTPGRRSRSWERGSADYLPSSSSWCASASGLYYSSSSSSVSNSQDKYQYTASGRWNNLDPTRRNKKSSIQYTKEFRQSQSDHTAALTDRTRWIQLIYEEALKMTIKLASVRDITGGVGISYKSSQILTPSVAICAGCGCGAEQRWHQAAEIILILWPCVTHLTSREQSRKPFLLIRNNTGGGSGYSYKLRHQISESYLSGPWETLVPGAVNSNVWLDCWCLLKSMHR